MTEETRDQHIGRTLAILRGGVSQQALADEMRERGHKWSQSTVWSVEKGERPLRFSEAQDVATILGIEWEDLALGPEESELLIMANELGDAGLSVADAVYDFEARSYNFVTYMLAHGAGLQGQAKQRVDAAAHLKVTDVVAHGEALFMHDVEQGGRGPQPEPPAALRRRRRGVGTGRGRALPALESGDREGGAPDGDRDD